MDPLIHFYLPRRSWPKDLEGGDGFFWSSRRGGNSNWTLQTYFQMRAEGVPCDLTETLPRSGIIVAHTRDLPKRVLPNRRRVLVCIEADRGRRPFCQFHVQQNPVGTEIARQRPQARLDRRIAGLNDSNYYICYWPQPELVPRDPRRGDRLENVVFMGRAANIAPELLDPGFHARLEAQGMRFIFQEDVGKWNDYSEVDAILAVRDFSGLPHHRKPASKLINAWHAGVPALLAPESAFMAERRSELDFIVVRSVDDIVQGLQRLKTDPDLRRRMVENGMERAVDRSVAAVSGMWRHYLQDIVVPAYERWQDLGVLRRTAFILARCLGYFDRTR